MKPIYLFCLLSVAVYSLSGCRYFGNPVAKLWFYTYSSDSAENRDTSLTAVSFLEIRPDGTYTRDFGKFEYGKWDYTDKVLKLRNQHEKTLTVPVEFPGFGEMRMHMDKGVVADFESQPLPGHRPSQDPFSMENNKWRIPASGKENDVEIRSRLRNHCQFWEAYFTWALKEGLSTVDVRSTPTLIKIYGNGFGLKPYEELPGQWKSYFFDEEDCRKANAQIKDIFDKRTIAWANTESKYKMFIGAFQQIEQYLK